MNRASPDSPFFAARAKLIQVISGPQPSLVAALHTHSRSRRRDMDAPMAGFAAYQLMQVDTGISLYVTCATEQEILQANANLRNRGLTSRFVPAHTFTAPSLHDPL